MSFLGELWTFLRGSPSSPRSGRTGTPPRSSASANNRGLELRCRVPAWPFHLFCSPATGTPLEQSYHLSLCPTIRGHFSARQPGARRHGHRGFQAARHVGKTSNARHVARLECLGQVQVLAPRTTA